MTFTDPDARKGPGLWLVFVLLAILLTLTIGISLFQHGAQVPPPSAASAASQASPPRASNLESASAVRRASQVVSDAATVTVENGVVKFYFASGNAELAAGAGEALAVVVKGAQAGRKLVIAGFHDDSGDAAKNALLARQRALAVRDALRAAGAPAQQIELKNAEPMAASGSSAEARRVEISMQ